VVSGHGALRAGHSLPELVVAVAFLGATVGVVGASSVLGARQVALAALRHEAIRAASTALDSVAAAPAPAAGGRATARLLIRWTPVARLGGPGLSVTVVSRADGRPLATLVGAVPPSVDTLPRVGAGPSGPGSGP
jgi:hypothetical protein